MDLEGTGGGKFGYLGRGRARHWPITHAQKQETSYADKTLPATGNGQLDSLFFSRNFRFMGARLLLKREIALVAPQLRFLTFSIGFRRPDVSLTQQKSHAEPPPRKSSTEHEQALGREGASNVAGVPTIDYRI